MSVGFAGAPGDVLLYSGTHRLHVRQEEITGCRWAQVALIVAIRSHPNLLVFEATTLSPCADVLTGQLHRGVQLSTLSERMARFTGQMAVRRWMPPLQEDALVGLREFVEEVHGRPFDENPRTACRAIRRRNRTSATDRFFCSHLVAEALQRMRLLAAPPGGRPSSNYIPADFSTEYPGASLPLVSEHVLTRERVILDSPGGETSRRRPP